MFLSARDQAQAVIIEVEDTTKHSCGSLGKVGYQVAVVVVDRIVESEVILPSTR